jgi:hypothetical protein
LSTIACVIAAGTGWVRNGFGVLKWYSGKPFGVPGPGVGDPMVNGTVLAG